MNFLLITLSICATVIITSCKDTKINRKNQDTKKVSKKNNTFYFTQSANKLSITYEYSNEKCTTGLHHYPLEEYNTTKDYFCKDILDEAKNNHCEHDARVDKYNKWCKK